MSDPSADLQQASETEAAGAKLPIENNLPKDYQVKSWLGAGITSSTYLLENQLRTPREVVLLFQKREMHPFVVATDRFFSLYGDKEAKTELKDYPKVAQMVFDITTGDHMNATYSNYSRMHYERYRGKYDSLGNNPGDREIKSGLPQIHHHVDLITLSEAERSTINQIFVGLKNEEPASILKILIVEEYIPLGTTHFEPPAWAARTMEQSSEIESRQSKCLLALTNFFKIALALRDKDVIIRDFSGMGKGISFDEAGHVKLFDIGSWIIFPLESELAESFSFRALNLHKEYNEWYQRVRPLVIEDQQGEFREAILRVDHMAALIAITGSDYTQTAKEIKDINLLSNHDENSDKRAQIEIHLSNLENLGVPTQLIEIIKVASFSEKYKEPGFDFGCFCLEKLEEAIQKSTTH